MMMGDLRPELTVAFDELLHSVAARRYEAVILLGMPEKWFGVKPSLLIVEKLIPLLDDTDSEVRYYTAQSLGWLKFREALVPLRNHTSDSSAGVKRAIEKAIASIESS
jgi:HEAT repeat protein